MRAKRCVVIENLFLPANERVRRLARACPLFVVDHKRLVSGQVAITLGQFLADSTNGGVNGLAQELDDLLWREPLKILHGFSPQKFKYLPGVKVFLKQEIQLFLLRTLCSP